MYIVSLSTRALKRQQGSSAGYLTKCYLPSARPACTPCSRKITRAPCAPWRTRLRNVSPVQPFPTDCSHAILYRRLKLRYFFRFLKIEGCYGTHKENFICGQRTVGYMVGAPACGWVKTERTPSAGNTEKATNPRENERVENSVPWFDRDKMAYFHSSRIFGEDGPTRIEIGAGRRSDEGIAPNKSKKRPSFLGRDACLPSACPIGRRLSRYRPKKHSRCR